MYYRLNPLPEANVLRAFVNNHDSIDSPEFKLDIGG
jgi:hypothetical protein